jgi:hypothetical protein
LASDCMFSTDKHVFAVIKRLCFCLAFLFCCPLVISVASAVSADVEDSKQPVVPVHLGQEIYRINSELPNQIYIVAQSHRGSLSGRSGILTEQIQAEVFRLGEWLILNRQVELLLPEGFFRRSSGKSIKPAVSSPVTRGVSSNLQTLDDQTLVATLADTSRFVNADILLHNYMDIKVQQVEDKGLYLSVRDLLGRLMRCSEAEEDLVLNMLDYQQRKRSAIILQNIARILEEEYNNQAISHKNAIVSIGLAHVDEIIDFIEAGRIEISELPSADENCDCGQYSRSLLSLKEQYGITVILPRTLADQPDILRLAGVRFANDSFAD